MWDEYGDYLYTYDGLNRLTDANMGDLDANHAMSPYLHQYNWTLDDVGNWSGYTVSWLSLNQERKHNKANEIHDETDAITEGQGQTAWKDPNYDARGNMTAAPQALSETTLQHLVYDAWDRLVAVWRDDGDGAFETGEDTLVAEYRYGRRRAKRRVPKTRGRQRRSMVGVSVLTASTAM